MIRSYTLASNPLAPEEPEPTFILTDIQSRGHRRCHTREADHCHEHSPELIKHVGLKKSAIQQCTKRGGGFSVTLLKPRNGAVGGVPEKTIAGSRKLFRRTFGGVQVPYRRLFLLIRGDDDERFFKAVLGSLLENIRLVQFWKYASKKPEKVFKFLQSIALCRRHLFHG